MAYLVSAGNSEVIHANHTVQRKGFDIQGDTTGNTYGQLPHLLPLADNGGPTPTHAFAEGRPATVADNCPTFTTDQRGEPRS